MSEGVIGVYGQPVPPPTQRPKSLMVNPRGFIRGGINKGIPPYLLPADQWLDSWNMVFDFDRARALPPRRLVDTFVASPTELQAMPNANQTTAFVPTPVPRTGQAADEKNILYPGVPVYDHDKGPNPEPGFDPLDPYKANTNGFPPLVSNDTVVAVHTIATSFNIAATQNPVSYNAIGLPHGLAIDKLTGLITGNVDIDFSTPVRVKITATNAFGTGEGILTINPGQVFTFSQGGSLVNTPLWEYSTDGGVYKPVTILQVAAFTQFKMRLTLTPTTLLSPFYQVAAIPLTNNINLLAGSIISAVATVVIAGSQIVNYQYNIAAGLPVETVTLDTSTTGSKTGFVDLNGTTLDNRQNIMLLQNGASASNIVLETIYNFEL